MRELFKNKDYVLLFSGNLVSELGNVLFSFVAGLYVADLTGLPSMLAIFMALGAFLRIIVSPFAGVLVDRWNKIRIIYLTDYMRGAIFLITTYFFVGDIGKTEATTILLIVVGLSGIIGAFFGPAITSSTPDIVGLDKLQAANGANSIIGSSTQIVGIVFGIIAFSLFSFEVALLINGISFVLSGFSEMFIRPKHRGEVVQTKESFLTDFKVGFTYMKKHRGLLNLMLYSLFINFALTPLLSVGIPSLLRIQLGRSAWEIGWLNITFSIFMMLAGLVIGSITLRSIASTIRRGLGSLVLMFIFVTVDVYLFSINAYGYWVFYWIFMVGFALLAIGMMATNVPLQTGMVKVIDAQKRGRVFAIIGSLSAGLTPLSMLLGGFIIEATSVAFLGLICSAILLVPTIGFMVDKSVKHLLSGIENHQPEVGVAIVEG